MRHSGNTGTIVDQHFEPMRVEATTYVYDEVGHFVTVCRLKVTETTLKQWLTGIQKANDEAAQDELPF